jgi:ribonuclease HI
MDNVIIFADGSSRGNPGPGGWGAIVSVGGKVIELGAGSKHTTNNKMELSGALNALKEVGNKKEIILNTDSSYVINGMTKWIFGWQKNGWRNSMKDEVANRDLWEELIKVSEGKKIKWNYVAGHSDIPGNERCDEIATSFADGKKIDLYNGKLSQYSIDLTKTKGIAKAGKKKSKSGMAYSYLSLVNGVFKIDKTWGECEKRVKGKKGAKYQKSLSEIEEKEIMKKWGVK